MDERPTRGTARGAASRGRVRDTLRHHRHVRQRSSRLGCRARIEEGHHSTSLQPRERRLAPGNGIKDAPANFLRDLFDKRLLLIACVRQRRYKMKGSHPRPMHDSKTGRVAERRVRSRGQRVVAAVFELDETENTSPRWLRRDWSQGGPRADGNVGSPIAPILERVQVSCTHQRAQRRSGRRCADMTEAFYLSLREAKPWHCRKLVLQLADQRNDAHA